MRLEYRAVLMESVCVMMAILEQTVAVAVAAATKILIVDNAEV